MSLRVAQLCRPRHHLALASCRPRTSQQLGHNRVLSSILARRTLVSSPVLRGKVNATEGKVEVGDKAFWTRRITQQDVNTFCKMTLNEDPAYRDEEFAKSTCYGRSIIPGGLIYSALCEGFFLYIPGIGGISLTYSYEHPEPLYPGEEMKTEIEVMEKAKRKVGIKCIATEPKSGRIVARGYSQVLVPKHRA